MSLIRIYKHLEQAYVLLEDHDTQPMRDLVLSLLDTYNESASKHPSLYGRFKNAGDSRSVWIVPAYNDETE